MCTFSSSVRSLDELWEVYRGASGDRLGYLCSAVVKRKKKFFISKVTFAALDPALQSIADKWRNICAARVRPHNSQSDQTSDSKRYGKRNSRVPVSPKANVEQNE